MKAKRMKKIMIICMLVLGLSTSGCLLTYTKFKIQDESGNSVSISKDGLEVDLKEIPCFDSFTCSTDSQGD